MLKVSHELAPRCAKRWDLPKRLIDQGYDRFHPIASVRATPV